MDSKMQKWFEIKYRDKQFKKNIIKVYKTEPIGHAYIFPVEIVYKNGRFACTLNGGKDTFGFSPYSRSECDDVEVISNICENPELCKNLN